MADVNVAIRLKIAAPVPFQPIFRVPATGTYVQLKHDYQCPEMEWRPRDAATRTEVPETIPLQPVGVGETEHVVLTRDMQEWMLRVLRLPHPEMSRAEAVARWHNLTRNSVCFTDKWSWNYGDIIGDPAKNCADYLYGMGLANPPMRWKKLAMGGNVHRLLAGDIIEAIDPRYCLDLDPAKLYAERPWLFAWGTQCYMEQVGMENGRPRYKVSRFPQFGPGGVLYPLMGEGGRIRVKDAWRLRAIANGAEWSPYYSRM